MTEAPALRLAQIAATSGRLPERAKALLVELGRLVAFDASWIALADPLGTGYIPLASTSLNQRTVEYLSSPEMAHDIEVTGGNSGRPPLSPSDLPYRADELQRWAECRIPAGYQRALAVALFVPGPRHVGLLALPRSYT